MFLPQAGDIPKVFKGKGPLESCPGEASMFLPFYDTGFESLNSKLITQHQLMLTHFLLVETRYK